MEQMRGFLDSDNESTRKPEPKALPQAPGLRCSNSGSSDKLRDRRMSHVQIKSFHSVNSNTWICLWEHRSLCSNMARHTWWGQTEVRTAPVQTMRYYGVQKREEALVEGNRKGFMDRVTRSIQSGPPRISWGSGQGWWGRGRRNAATQSSCLHKGMLHGMHTAHLARVSWQHLLIEQG